MKKIIESKENSFLYYFFEEHEKEALLITMSDLLRGKGYVKETYQAAVIKREHEFPTGLPTKGVSVAIPHTDSEYVEKEGILVGVLNTPVTFEVMASDGDYVDVELVFMLAIKEPQNQVMMLQRLITLCQDEEKLRLLKAAEDLEKIDSLLQTIQ